MKRVLAYAATFMAGSLLSGGVAMAATTTVQAQKGNSTVQLNGQVVEKPPKLVYGGTTYVQLYSIEQGLKQAGITPSWDGTNFNMTTSSAITPQDFATQVQNVMNSQLSVMEQFPTITTASNQQTVTQMTQQAGSEEALRRQVSSWNVSDPGELQVKDDLIFIITTWENGIITGMASINDYLKGDVTDSTSMATATTAMFQIVALKKQTLKADAAKAGFQLNVTAPGYMRGNAK